MWHKLPIRMQQYIAAKVNHYGYRHNNQRLVIWGLTHFPVVIEETE